MMKLAGKNPSQALTVGALADALRPLGARLSGSGSALVTGLAQDSRSIEPGEVFAARKGARADGMAFVPAAVERGAVAVLVERGVALPDTALPIIQVDDMDRAIAAGAELAYGCPSHDLKLVGITGTNGKTTVSFLCAHAVDAAGGRAARLGTLGYAFRDYYVDTGLTTPQADQVSRLMARARASGATHFVMETSSHALAQARVEALCFHVAVFTNFTQDHLDYHGSMQDYFGAKLRLFTELQPAASVVNVDDPHGVLVAAAARGPVLRVSRYAASRAEVRAEEVQLDARGIRATVLLPSGRVKLQSSLVGEHNLENLLVTLGVIDALGLDVGAAVHSIEQAPPVPGRLERCDENEDDILVLVDYAHTPDALERALHAVRGFGKGTLTCVFGCGGDRDPAKRPKMGEAVARGADRAIITNDNPRSEDPGQIALAIEQGLGGHAGRYEVILDRAVAIERAILEARPGDVVLIAGKGHEAYQIVGPDRYDFDDREQARRALARRRAAEAEN